jgi:hypothetical protein
VHRAPLILAAARNNVPAVFWNPAFTRDGGLLSYGPDPVDIFRRAATYVDRILRGEKPGDLPVQLPTKYEMVVNRKTATILATSTPATVANPDTTPTASGYMPSLETAARSLKVVPIITPVHSDVEIETAIMALGREPGGGLVVMPDAWTQVHRVPIISAAARNKVPAVYTFSFFARDGGLLTGRLWNGRSRLG